MSFSSDSNSALCFSSDARNSAIGVGIFFWRCCVERGQFQLDVDVVLRLTLGKKS